MPFKRKNTYCEKGKECMRPFPNIVLALCELLFIPKLTYHFQAGCVYYILLAIVLAFVIATVVGALSRFGHRLCLWRAEVATCDDQSRRAGK